VLDDRLTGYWSDDDVYQGAMEAADIAFRGDGTGWTYWSRDGGAFEVLRFGWQTTAGLQLTIDLHELLWGTWDLSGLAVHHRIRDCTRRDEQVVLTYEVTTGHTVFRESATLLVLSRPIVIGTIGDRFAFKRELAQTDQDPTINAQRW
jgi:hypothetical protein